MTNFTSPVMHGHGCSCQACLNYLPTDFTLPIYTNYGYPPPNKPSHSPPVSDTYKAMGAVDGLKQEIKDLKEELASLTDEMSELKHLMLMLLGGEERN